MERGDLFIVSAPSGAGKTTLLKRLFEEVDGLVFSVSHTTRAPRPGEVHGRDYYFVAEAEFEAMLERGEFLEWAEVHGNFYGTSRGAVEDALRRGLDVVLEIDVQGARQVKEAFPQAVLVFIMPPSLEELERRLSSRGTEGEESLRLRLENARAEIRQARWYEYIIVNDVLEKAARVLASVVLARRARAERVLPGLSGLGL